jgi:hypothetical protein
MGLRCVCDTLRLTLSSPVEEGPTHFPYNKDLTPTVIDLMFVPAEVSLTTEHEIHPDLRGTSDHAPLTVTLPGPDSEVPVTHWSIQSGTDEEQAYLGEVLESLESLLGWEGQTAGEVDEVVEAISTAFSKAWDSQAKETRRGKYSNGWWTQECSDSIAAYRTLRDADDWADYWHVMHATKCDFFEDHINHVASINQRTWDLMAWMHKCNLPTYEAISYRGVPCNSLESLWDALDGLYNAAAACPVDLSFLHPVMLMPLWEWVPFSSLELSEALTACAHNSSPGPDHIMWSYLKYWCGSKGVAALFTRIANACIHAGHWPTHFKESLLVIIPKPGKASYSTPKSFRPIVLLFFNFIYLFNQQFIMRCSIAVRGHAIQTVCTLRLRYTLPVTTYQVLKASFWWAATDIRPAASSKTMLPFRAVNAGMSHQAAEIAMSIPGLPSERSPNWNPPQRAGQSPEGVKPL